eukprot:272374_1
MVNTTYGFNTKPRRQTFLSLWLFFTSVFGFVFVITPKRTTNLNLYAVTFALWSIGSFLMMLSAAMQLSRIILLPTVILMIGSISACISSWNFVATSCTDHSFCGMVHFAFDFTPLGIAIIISIDAISSILESKRSRVALYSFILFVSSTLTVPYFYGHHDGWTGSVLVYLVTLVVMALSSGLFFISIGLVGSLHSSWFHCILTLVLAVSSVVKTMSGFHYVSKDVLSSTGRGFFICHLLLSWAVSFCVVMDTKYLTMNAKNSYDQLMHIAEKRESDFRHSADWENDTLSSAATDGSEIETDTDLESMFDS